ncbi:accessory gene regulator protein AgrB [Anaerosolibacter carboniphilus]|uniref:Accessory gene regulator protein AgrB n=1 Tax=Anaerosolibacter carboniphilus TaxID=1417629 RepID=A0A841KNC3_9FIRM|nr:accessory gene regulator B family protein [Anaerosolibacter carboniphilus]MBB6214937.1 accessory gene regulator protein AgrB [Anaerosolibacter carboniphilus]
MGNVKLSDYLPEKYRGGYSDESIERIIQFGKVTSFEKIKWVGISVLLTIPIHTWDLTLAFVFTYMLLRRCFGGFHFQNKNLCFAVTVGFTVLFSFLSAKIQLDTINIILIYVFAFATIKTQGVVANPKRPIKPSLEAKLLRHGKVTILLIMIIQIVLYRYGRIDVSNAILFGIIAAFANLYIKNE